MSGIKKGRPNIPKLPLSAFTHEPQPTKRLNPSSLIDSQVTSDLSGYAKLNTHLKRDGFIFVQSSVTSKGTTKSDWETAALEEIESICNQALSLQSPPLLAIIPRAPVNLGATAISDHLTKLLSLPSLQKVTSQSSVKNLIKGFTYPLNEVSSGFMLKDEFIEGLKWLGENGYVFEVVLDAGGKEESVLEETIECISKVHSSQADESLRTSFILDNLSSPSLLLDPSIPLPAKTEAYIRSYFSLSLLPNISIKLSGLLSCAPEKLVKRAFEEFDSKVGDHGRNESISSLKSLNLGGGEEQGRGVLKRRVVNILENLLEAFGDSRIFVGSDWPSFAPLCLSTAGNEEDESKAFNFVIKFYLNCLTDLGLEGESLDRVFAGNAQEIYGI